ncbi:MAG: MFS transporter, partial [Halieaceae bacterium]|nr:MFS transporter [Halieaceae bacterium]
MNPAILAGVLLITGVHAFDELVLVVAMPVISADLDARAHYGLIIASYILASIVGMNWAGRETDRRGPFPVFIVACAIFSAGILLAAGANNTAAFIGGRVLQGIGGGIGWTLTFALISLTCPPAEKARAVAAMDIAWVLPSLLAPLLGGILVQYFSWRWVFLLQLLPVGAALLLISPRIRHFQGDGMANDPWLLVGALRIAVAVGIVLYCLSVGPGPSWLLVPPALWLMAEPMRRFMPAGWWRMGSPLSVSLVMALLAFIVFYSMEAYAPLFLIDVREISTLQAGLVMTCASVFWMVGSQLSARNLLGRDYALRMLIGLALLIVGMGSMASMLFAEASVMWAYPCWCIAGLGMGITFNTTRTTAMEHTPPGQDGEIGGSVNLSISLGLALATGLGGAIVNHSRATALPLGDA